MIAAPTGEISALTGVTLRGTGINYAAICATATIGQLDASGAIFARTGAISGAIIAICGPTAATYGMTGETCGETTNFQADLRIRLACFLRCRHSTVL